MIHTYFSCRSQSASAISADESLLHIIGGRSHSQVLQSMQSVGMNKMFEEQQIEIDSELVSSWFASAVTLTTGNIVLTGGRHTANEAVLRSNQGIWTGLPQMIHGRYGHSSCSIFHDDNEHVLVAGGWDREGGIQATVELYKISKPERGWIEIGSMVSPRTLFTLQVYVMTYQNPDN